MSLHTTLAERPAVTHGVTIGVIVLAAAFIAVQVVRPRNAVSGQQLFFTTDDGQTTFADAADRRPPFDYHGKSAVRAYVYACPGDQPFVAYLERYTPAVQKALADPNAPAVGPVDREFLLAQGTEVKRPGENEWVKRASDAGERIIFGIKCPGHGQGTPQTVLPGD